MVYFAWNFLRPSSFQCPKKPSEVSVLSARELSLVALTIAYAYLFCLNYFISFVYMLFIIRLFIYILKLHGLFCMEMFAAILVSMPDKPLEVGTPMYVFCLFLCVLFARELSFVALTIAYAYLFCLNYFISFVYVIYYSLVYILKLHVFFAQIEGIYFSICEQLKALLQMSGFRELLEHERLRLRAPANIMADTYDSPVWKKFMGRPGYPCSRIGLQGCTDGFQAHVAGTLSTDFFSEHRFFKLFFVTMILFPLAPISSTDSSYFSSTDRSVLATIISLQAQMQIGDTEKIGARGFSR